MLVRIGPRIQLSELERDKRIEEHGDLEICVTLKSHSHFSPCVFLLVESMHILVAVCRRVF